MRWESARRRSLGGRDLRARSPSVESAAGLEAAFAFLGGFCLAAARRPRRHPRGAGSRRRAGGRRDSLDASGFAALDAVDRERALSRRADPPDVVRRALPPRRPRALDRAGRRRPRSSRPAPCSRGSVPVASPTSSATGSGRCVGSGFASAAGLLATALLAQSRISLVVTVIVVAGAVSMAWNGLSLTVAAELAGRARSGAAIGFQQTTLGLIGVLVPVLFANLVEATSWRTAFALSAVGPVAGWLMLGGCASGYEPRMHLYPQLTGPRYSALVADLASIILLVIFAWAGVRSTTPSTSSPCSARSPGDRRRRPGRLRVGRGRRRRDAGDRRRPRRRPSRCG